jgi:peptidoglycan/xylan/chitin deacetylase (PgdA/CDA1 family)
MAKMLADYKVDLNSLINFLWMSKENVKELHNKGHMIGLHTHTHPILTESLSKKGQFDEYTTNFDIIYGILGKRPVSMSHPCNSYNNDTISILEKLNIKLGFRANMVNFSNSQYEFPREDHANILKQMELNIR